MTGPLVILRPEPGASETNARAKAAGWDTLVAPMFDIQRRDWAPPNAEDFDALMLTSANAVRNGGEALERYHDLPVFAVGERTAETAERAGFKAITIGDSDGSALAGKLRNAGHREILHLTGKHSRAFDETDLTITRIAVYESVAVSPEGLANSLTDGVIIILHSPRAACHFATWCDGNAVPCGRLALAAISTNTLKAAGQGWRATEIADAATDEALLAAAAKLTG